MLYSDMSCDVSLCLWMQVRLPLLVLHGGSDVVTNPQLSAELVDKSSSKDKTLRLYEDAWHGLTAGEPDEMALQVVTDMIAWLRPRSPVAASSQGFAGESLRGSIKAARWQRPTLGGALEDDAESTLTSA